MELTDDQVAALAKVLEIEGAGDDLEDRVGERLLQLAEKRLLRTPEAAALLGVPRARLARWAWRGEVPSVKLTQSRNAWRYFEREVIEELRAGGQEALAKLSDNHRKQRVAA
jgi:predicted DNA-binding transcriptional regulator AlpA